MSPLPITLCVSTYNEAAQLEDCVATVRDWVSEIVVVDMESDDGTVELAERLGATVVRVPNAGWAEPGRQSGIAAARQPWVLVLDADERAGPELEAVAAAYVGRDDVDGVLLPRQNYLLGWWVAQAGSWPDWQLRLFRASKTTWPAHRTHVGAQVSGHVERAPARPQNAIAHHKRRYATIASYVTAVNDYSELEAERLARGGRRPTLRHLAGVPLYRFAAEYFGRRGYRAGRYGLALALLSAIYWLLAELKLWERELSAEHLPSGALAED